MNRIFYHNITLGKLNEHDFIEFMKGWTKDSNVYYSTSGNATLNKLTLPMIEEELEKHKLTMNGEKGWYDIIFKELYEV